jgi:hypothetical protein
MKVKINSPLLIIFYNRPKQTKKLLKLIGKINISKIYIKIDGCKNINDKKNVDLVIQCVEKFKNKFKNKIKIKIKKELNNLGLQKNILSAIDWVLQKNDRFIFLEDDHLPSETFFYFCEKFLKIYNYDNRVMQIKGSCFLDRNSDDFYFSKYSDCIGWATWKRSWKKLVKHFNYYNIQKLGLVNNFFQDYKISNWFNIYLYRETVKKYSEGLWSTWFQLTIAKYDGLCISPMKNLVVHQGILKSTNSVHYDKSYKEIKNYKLQNIDVSKVNKKKIEWNRILDKNNFKIILKTDPIFNIKNKIKWFIKYHFILKFNKKLEASLK